MIEPEGFKEPLNFNSAFSGLCRSVRRMNPLVMALIFSVLVLAPSAVVTLNCHIAIDDVFREFAKAYDANMPPLRIEKGRATVEGKEPAIYPPPDSAASKAGGRKFIVIYDTTGETTRIPREYEAGLLVTEDAVYTKGSSGETREVPLDDLCALTGDFVINGEFINRKRDEWTGWVTVLLGVLITIYLCIAKLIQTLIFGGLALVATHGRGKLTYGEGLRFGLASLVLPTALDTIQLIAGAHLPSALLVYFLTAGASTWLGVRRALAAGPELPAEDQDPGEWAHRQKDSVRPGSAPERTKSLHDVSLQE